MKPIRTVLEKTRNNVNLEYIVPIKVVFEGTVKVEAMTKMEAREIVDKNFRATLGDCFDNKNKQIIDWKINMKNTELQFRRVIKL